MSKSLVIVESPSKAKTINKYLGKDFVVESSVGHIKDLPGLKDLRTGKQYRRGPIQKTDYLDIEHGYKLKYVIIAEKKKVVAQLKKKAADAKEIFIATDPDREGEAIAWHVAQEIKSTKKKIKRVVFNEITKRAVLEAMKHPIEIDEQLVSAQEARRAMDRLVGFEISPILWKAIGKGLSAGRVQSVALKWIVDREAEIQHFIPQEFWTIDGVFSTQQNEEYPAYLFKILGQVVGDNSEDEKKLRIEDETTAKGYVKEILKQSYKIESVNTREQKKNPWAPFITSTLQQTAANVLRFSPKNTMRIAQQLYEGLEVAGETTGLITYMRTDSTRIAPEAIDAARMFALNNYGKEYVPAQPNIYGKAKKGAKIQDAHEAIRPTDVNLVPNKIKKYLEDEQFALYNLIWNRFLASQMTPAIDEIITVDTMSEDKEKMFHFRSTETKELFNGFRVLWQEKDNEEEEENDKTKLPKNIREGQSVHAEHFDTHQHFTKPLPRYTPSSLVKALEEKGIGRPSTYASIIDVIQEREYVELRERRFFATELGISVNKYLDSGFSDFLNENMTREMEKELDEIAEGEREYVEVMKDFDTRLEKTLTTIKTKGKKGEGTKIFATDEKGNKIKCKKCEKGFMVEKWKGNKKFAYCSTYPDCDNIMNTNEAGELVKAQEPVLTNEICPKCGSKMILREGRYGKFYACSTYPKCKGTKPYIDPSIEVIKCPKCNEGRILPKKSRRGKIFYSCGRWPDCDYALWDKPVNVPCKYCDSPLLTEKFSQKHGKIIICPKCKTVQ